MFLKYKLRGDGKEFVEALCIIFAVSKLYNSSIFKIFKLKYCFVIDSRG